MRRLVLVIAAVVLATSFAVTRPASAGSEGLSVHVPGSIGFLRESGMVLSVSPVDLGACPSGLSVDDVEVNGLPVAWRDLSPNPSIVAVVIPIDSGPGRVEVFGSCIVDESTVELSGAMNFAAIVVTKVTEGAVPDSAFFAVVLGCAGREWVVNFTGSGGVRYFFVEQLGECTLSEPGNGGASAVRIEPSTIPVTAFTRYTATVTNTYPAPPVEAEPLFTG